MAKSYLDKDGLLYFLQKIRPSTTPSMDGTASTGTSKRFAAEDHVHPTDTTRAPLASPALTGTPTAPTAATGTANTQIATTAFVANTVGAMTSGVADVQIDNSSIVTSGIAKIPTASASAKGLMTSTHYSKLEGIASGAEVNQNAFSTVKVGSTSLVADSTTDTLNITAGTNITLSPTASSDSFSIATTAEVNQNAVGNIKVGNTTMPAVGKTDTFEIKAGSNVTIDTDSWASSDSPIIKISATDTTYSDATTTTHGLMTAADKTKIDKLSFDSSNKISASILPSYVDDVIESYSDDDQTELTSSWLVDSSGNPLTPESGKIYVVIGHFDAGYATSGGSFYLNQYRWGGSAYVKLNDGGVSAITNAEIDTIVAS